MSGTFHYIIVGSGTASCVLAHRLSEGGRYSVSLLEHGDDDRAVVVLDIRLRGVDGLRVVDASAIAAVPSANINARVLMITEKAADRILGSPPLPPEPVAYYRAV